MAGFGRVAGSRWDEGLRWADGVRGFAGVRWFEGVTLSDRGGGCDRRGGAKGAGHGRQRVLGSRVALQHGRDLGDRLAAVPLGEQQLGNVEAQGEVLG